MNYRYPDRILDSIIDKEEKQVKEEINKLIIENKRLKVRIGKIISALNFLDTDEKRIRMIKAILHKELKEKQELNK